MINANPNPDRRAVRINKNTHGHNTPDATAPKISCQLKNAPCNENSPRKLPLEWQKRKEALINFGTKGKGCATLSNIWKQNRRQQKALMHARLE